MLFLSDSFSILRKGQSKSLRKADLPPINSDLRYKRILNKLKKILKNKPGISLYNAFCCLISKQLIYFFCFSVCYESIGIAIPFFLKYLINIVREIALADQLKNPDCKFSMIFKYNSVNLESEFS